MPRAAASPMLRPPPRHSPLLLALALVAALACSACGNARNQGTTSATRSSSARSRAATTTTPSSTTASSTTTTTSSSAALPGAGRPPITVGDKNYTEQFVLGQLYVQALQAQGFSVSLNQNIGPAQVAVQSLKAGALSMYPEYLNTFNTTVAGYTEAFGSQLDAYQAAQRYALAHGLELLSPTPALSDTQAIAVTDAYAEENHLRTIGDLRRVAATLTIGGPPEFQQTRPGLGDLNDTYGVVPATFKPIAVGDQYGALNAATVQAADVNTTDGELATGDYAVLKDPRRVFGWGNVIPVVSAHTMAVEGPAFVDTIQRVDDALRTADMRQMNELVDIAQQDPAAVAKQFLQTHRLLTPLTTP